MNARKTAYPELVEGLHFLPVRCLKKGQGFDKLSPSGVFPGCGKRDAVLLAVSHAMVAI